MKELIVAKVAQVPEFENTLLGSSDCVLAEATPDKCWASGLSSDTTSKTLPDTWSGLNMLGKLLMEVRDSILLNLSETDDDASNVESPAPDPIFLGDSPQISSATSELNTAPTGMATLRQTGLSDTKETSTSATPSSQSTVKIPPKLIKKTLTVATNTNAPTMASSNNQNLKKKENHPKHLKRKKLTSSKSLCIRNNYP